MQIDKSLLDKLVSFCQNNPLASQRTGNDNTYNQFLSLFPKAQIGQLTLDEYALGAGSKSDNFCRWIERVLEPVLGRYSPGTSRGHILFKKKNGTLYKNRLLADMEDGEALAYILKIHQVIAQANPTTDISWLDDEKEIYKKANVSSRLMMGGARKARLLTIYNPDEILPITSSDHLGHYLKVFGVPKEEIPHKKQVISRLSALTKIYHEFKSQFANDLTPFGFMKALYSNEVGIRPASVKFATATADDTIDEITEQDSPALNQILYGPPGTGKTYSTTLRAVTLADPEWVRELEEQDDDSDEFRTLIKSRYDELVKNGRIAFTTFHQSFAYEDFIEGIRANIDNETNSLAYKVEPGVFKKIAAEADHAISTNSPIGLGESPQIWKISIGTIHDTKLRKAYIDKGVARIGWNSMGDLRKFDDSVESEQLKYWKGLSATTKNTIQYFYNEVKIGDVFLCLKDQNSIQAIGVITGEYTYEPDEIGYSHSRKVNWILKDINLDIRTLNDNYSLVQKAVYPLNRITWNDLLKEAENQQITLPNILNSEKDKPAPNYVLIIDEINRGNISRIFGELITLLEPDKRKDGSDAREVILPYSKERFSVPSNLYVLGTMNTADKSLSQLDLALRRRFEFIEILPDPSLLEGIEVHGVQISALLDTLNQRIEVLLDRDHTIGHAYFWPLIGIESIEKRAETLARIFEKRIIPLLQEYFFADWERIGWVLNDIDKLLDHRFIQMQCDLRSANNLFSSKIGNELQDRRYIINAKAFISPEAYQGIFTKAGI